MNKFKIYGLLSMICLLVCWLIVKYFNNQPFVRGFTGDVIIIFMVYFLLRIFRNDSSINLALFTLTVAFATEGLQYFKLGAALGLEENTAFKLILGSVFDPYDLIAYGIGAIGVYLFDTRIVTIVFGQARGVCDHDGGTKRVK